MQIAGTRLSRAAVGEPGRGLAGGGHHGAVGERPGSGFQLPSNRGRLTSAGSGFTSDRCKRGRCAMHGPAGCLARPLQPTAADGARGTLCLYRPRGSGCKPTEQRSASVCRRHGAQRSRNPRKLDLASESRAHAIPVARITNSSCDNRKGRRCGVYAMPLGFFEEAQATEIGVRHEQVRSGFPSVQRCHPT